MFAGTVVKAGRLIMSATKVGDETAVSRIVHLVEEAAHRKATIQAFADRFSAQLIPANFGLAGLVFALTRTPDRALNMLIIDYSCGVRLSTATALSAAIATAARNGILIKGSNYLEMLAEADTLVLDKTGTVTEGRPQVTSVVAAEPGRRRTRTDRARGSGRGNIDSSRLDRVRRPGAPQGLGYPEAWSRPWSASAAAWKRPSPERRCMSATRRSCASRGSICRGADEAARDLMRRGEQVIYLARDRAWSG